MRDSETIRSAQMAGIYRNPSSEIAGAGSRAGTGTKKIFSGSGVVRRSAMKEDMSKSLKRRVTMALRTITLCAALGLTALSPAWDDVGHMVVADIAYHRLTPKVKAEVDRLLLIGGTERTQTFVTAACWADDIRRQHHETSTWHYIDLHFRQDGKPVTNKPDAENVVWAIDKFKRVLGDRSATDADRADALRYIEHFVGDVHQPLHATSLDSDALPAGDAGGNKFPIVPPPIFSNDSRPPKNLHALWDLGAGLFPSEDHDFRPLSAERLAIIDNIARSVTVANPKPRNLNENPMEWAQESLAFDKSFVYNLQPNTVPSAEYLAKARTIAGRQVSLAGYRLADVLNKVLG